MDQSTLTRRVPFLDLGPVHQPLKDAILDGIADVIDGGRFTNGREVAEFEAAFADYTGSRCCVGVASGLDALRLALVAAGIEPGSEVIVPASTFVATFEAVTQAGGAPVIVDVDDTAYGMDPRAVEAALSDRTRFLMPVHLYGQMADMRALTRLADERGYHVLEDACQAHGARRDGLRAGTAGMAGAFSFYPGKNLGAMGDAGALVTDDELLAARVRAMREHGQLRKYEHAVEGWTARLDTIQALVLLHKLPLLDDGNEQRRGIASFYSEALAGVGDLRLPAIAHASEPVWHLYVVRTAEPDSLARYLGDRGIATGRHYPEPPHLSEAYAWLGHRRGEFPVSEALASEGLSLPIFPGMAEDQVEAVVDGVRGFFARG